MQKQYHRQRVFSSYVLIMKFFQPFLLLFVTAINAGAQPVLGRDTASAQAALEQRRTELRSLLKAARMGEAQLDVPDSGMANRHLSMQERADLREQLRQQRRDGKSE
jgi:hypothetical protein